MTQVVLFAEGEVELGRQVRTYLKRAGHIIRTATKGDVRRQAEEMRPSLILFDGTLSPSSGIDLCLRIRQTPCLARTPIILLIAGETEDERIRALELGCDDFLTPPFSGQELVARVHAVLRRFSRALRPAVLKTGDIEIDNSAMRLMVRGSEIGTTTLEFRLMAYLARNQGRVMTRDQLLDAVWGDMQFVTPRSVDACVRRIREKIEPDSARPVYLKTIRGVGYRLDSLAAQFENIQVEQSLAS